MKTRMITGLLVFAMISSMGSAQTILAKWTFPSGTATDSFPDGGLPMNATKYISAMGGTSAIDFTKNGATTKSAMATNWDSGNGIKYWQIEVSATGYENLRLTSKQQSGGASSGPKYFKAQYKLGVAGSWTDIMGADITCANDFVAGVLDSISMPAACDNAGSLFIRWIMTSDSAINGTLVAPAGLNKMDDIYITGAVSSVKVNEISGTDLMEVFPVPSHDVIHVNCGEIISELAVYDLTGRIMMMQKPGNQMMQISVRDFAKGIYFIKIRTEKSDRQMVRKIVIE